MTQRELPVELPLHELRATMTTPHATVTTTRRLGAPVERSDCAVQSKRTKRTPRAMCYKERLLRPVQKAMPSRPVEPKKPCAANHLDALVMLPAFTGRFRNKVLSPALRQASVAHLGF
jgi:hypothetical protein